MSLVALPKPLSSLSTKFGCIVADPPWPEYGGGKIKRGADRHYPLMKVEEIAALPVSSIALPDSHLYLWVTNNYLAKGAHVTVAQGWGFRPVTVITWVKDGKAGLGQYFRGLTEHVVFCVRGAAPYKLRADGIRAQGLTVIMEEGEGVFWIEPRPGIHSRKPVRIYEYAELVSHGPYLEMFARTARQGWEAWGNQAPEALSIEDVLNG